MCEHNIYSMLPISVVLSFNVFFNFVVFRLFFAFFLYGPASSFAFIDSFARIYVCITAGRRASRCALMPSTTAPVAGTSNSRMSGQITNLPRPLSHALHEWNNVIVNEIYFRVGSVAAAMMLFRILLAHSNSLMSSN